MTGRVREQNNPLSEQIAEIIAGGYDEHAASFRDVTGGARDRFARRQWSELHDDAVAMMDLYSESVNAMHGSIDALLGEARDDRALWGAARDHYAGLIAEYPDPEIATTFFNSITRRVFATVGIDDQIEFATIVDRPTPPVPTRHLGGTVEDVVRAALTGAGIPGQWTNLARETKLAAEEIAASVAEQSHGGVVDGAEMLDTVFYRGPGAYLIGRIRAGASSFPVAFCILHTNCGLVL